MKELPSTIITRNDPDWKEAVNYSEFRQLCSTPVTLEHDGFKFILNAGNSDQITAYIDKSVSATWIHILSCNKGLEYIGLQSIDMSDGGSLNAFLDGSDLHTKGSFCYGILKKSPFKQLKILLEYT